MRWQRGRATLMETTIMILVFALAAFFVVVAVWAAFGVHPRATMIFVGVAMIAGGFAFSLWRE